MTLGRIISDGSGTAAVSAVASLILTSSPCVRLVELDKLAGAPNKSKPLRGTAHGVVNYLHHCIIHSTFRILIRPSKTRFENRRLADLRL
jgi:hypothetical protein